MNLHDEIFWLEQGLAQTANEIDVYQEKLDELESKAIETQLKIAELQHTIELEEEHDSIICDATVSDDEVPF